MKWLDFKNLLQNLHFNHHQTIVLNQIILALVFVIAAITSFYLIRFLISKVINKIILKSRNDYDDLFVKNKVFEVTAHIFSALILFYGVEFIYQNAKFGRFVDRTIYIYLIIALIVLIFRLLNTLNEIYEIYAQKNKITVHIKQFLEVIKIILIIIAVIIAISVIINTKPGKFLTGLGAMTAVLTLVFKDAILSFVASIQISAYKLISIGDWITIPTKNVDGDVIDLSLNSIKLRNFDNSISSVPTYLFIQEPFINWRGMEQSGGRRIKRALFFNVNSIVMANLSLMEKLSKFEYLTEFINDKLNRLGYVSEMDNENSEHITSKEINITNLTLFRIYVEKYLKANLRSYKKIKKETYEINGIKTEKFVVEDLDELRQILGNEIEEYTQIIDDKTVINNTDKFLLRFHNYFLLENDNIYFIHKYQKLQLINGVELKVDQIEKITTKEGMFSDDLRMVVKQLQPGDSGIPLEIYVFAATTEWEKFENIQSEFLEHLYAIIPEFELKLYQRSAS